MTRHLLRLIWNRKRSNFLIMLEILCAFLVLEGVMLATVHYVHNYRQPLGYSIDNVWSIQVDTRRGPGKDEALRQSQMAIVQQLLNATRDLAPVEAVCASFTAPYSNASWGSGFALNGRKIDYGVNQSTDECDKVFGIQLLRGRWFSKEDDGVSWIPIVINTRFAADVFGETDPIGKLVPRDRDPQEEKAIAEMGAEPRKQMRVVGIMQDFRQHGEYSTPEKYIVQRMDLAAAKAGPPRLLLVRLRAGTTPAFEETLARQLQSVARDWSFEIQHLANAREDMLRGYTAPLAIAAVVAGFMLLMVALGLTGVVWQNVTQRIREIGLRRAKGARIENIHQQILGELVVMTSFALLIGVLVLAQVPLLPIPALLTLLSPGVVIVSVVISVLAIYLLTIGCGWYPARLATKIQPAEALHYE